MKQEIYMAREIENKMYSFRRSRRGTKHLVAMAYPIYQSATYAHPGVGQSTGYDYSRLQNPTREHLEKTVASLENGIDALAFSSGMAAITLMMELFKPGESSDRGMQICMVAASVYLITYLRKTESNFQCGLPQRKCRSIYQRKHKSSLYRDTNQPNDERHRYQSIS